ncbi:putative aarf domain-containing protein kinase [Quercus suber]|uniref:Aarf domain-containing protein kinase n=1 Tax=Quercus suber TaxID=58331 RepID=A0AAW0M0T0_QUESU
MIVFKMILFQDIFLQDLIPPSYLDELSLLQDRISPFSTEVAFNTIEQELGLPIDEIFSEISPEPIAAASLGQVYQARLRRSGEVVAVKVQRPGVQAAISLDILILRFLAGLLRRAGKLNTDLQAVVDEWASSLFRGEKLSEVKDLYLVEVGVYCSFNQLLEYGFYHADPHPGNLLRTYDGKLAYLDFGMMGEFKQELRDGFIEACLHLVNRDFDALAKDFVTLGLLPPTADKEAVTKALTGVFQDAVAKGVRNISFGDLLGNLGTTMYKFKFQIPSYFSLVIRSLAVLEGIAISSNPDYKVLGSTYPWIARKVLTDSSPQLKSSLQNLLYESLRARTEKALVRKPAEETNSRVVVKQVLSFTLTEKGAFVRDILLQEIAKGLDALGIATLDSITSTATASIPFISFFSFSSMTDEDKVNLRTLHRLMLLVSGHQPTENNNTGLGGVSPYKSQNVYPEEASLVFNQLASVQEILPILSVISELPPESQQQLFSLPADLAGRLISRVTARTIRRMFL